MLVSCGVVISMRAIDVFECFTMIQVEANVDTFDALVRKLLFRFMNRCHRSTNVFVCAFALDTNK